MTRANRIPVRVPRRLYEPSLGLFVHEPGEPTFLCSGAAVSEVGVHAVPSSMRLRPRSGALIAVEADLAVERLRIQIP